jgi:hypothetical protein
VGSPALLQAQGTTEPGSDVDREGADFLLLPVGARTVGMGGAVTAQRGNAESVIWSPAGIAALDEGRLLFNHHEGVFDVRSEVLSFLWPTKKVGTLGLTYYLVDFGDLSSTGEDGTVIGTLSVRNQEFLVTLAGRLIGNLEAGVSYKLVQLIFRCQGFCEDQQSFTNSTHAFDASLIYHDLVGLPLDLGASIRHFGFSLDGEDAGDLLPTRVRLGFSYELLSSFTSDSTFALALVGDLEDEWRDLGAPDFMLGSELAVADQFFLRVGYAFLEAGLGGPALGFGLTQDWFYVNLSRGFSDLSSATGEESTQVSFGVIF